MIPIFLMVWFVITQLGDAITTYIALNKGAREVNPLAAWLMNKIGNLPVILLKTVLAGALGTFLFKTEYGEWGLLIISATGSWVTWHNYRVIVA